MKILFNGLDQDMFENAINYITFKEVWDTITSKETEQVREKRSNYSYNNMSTSISRLERA